MSYSLISWNWKCIQKKLGSKVFVEFGHLWSLVHKKKMEIIFLLESGRRRRRRPGNNCCIDRRSTGPAASTGTACRRSTTTSSSCRLCRSGVLQCKKKNKQHPSIGQSPNGGRISRAEVGDEDRGRILGAFSESESTSGKGNFVFFLGRAKVRAWHITGDGMLTGRNRVWLEYPGRRIRGWFRDLWRLQWLRSSWLWDQYPFVNSCSLKKPLIQLRVSQ